jgi:CrcB protein
VQIVLLAAFGALGAVARYLVSGWVYRACGESFPVGTLAVNLIGCFLLGAIAHVGQHTELIAANYRQALTIGLLGAFTTFSTFGFETFKQLEAGQWFDGFLNIAVNVVVGLICVWGGIQTARYLVGGA